MTAEQSFDIPYLQRLKTDVYQEVHPDVGTAIVDAHRNQMVEIEHTTLNLTVSLPVISMESFQLGLFGRFKDEASRREAELEELRRSGRITPVLPVIYMAKSAAANRQIDVYASDVTMLYTQWVGNFTLNHTPVGYDTYGKKIVIEPVVYKATRLAYVNSQLGVGGSDLLSYARNTFALDPEQMTEDQILSPATVPLLTLVPVAAIDQTIASHIESVNRHSWHVARAAYTYGFYRWIDELVRNEERKKVRMKIKWDDNLIPQIEQQRYTTATREYQRAVTRYLSAIDKYPGRDVGTNRELVEQLLACVME